MNSSIRKSNGSVPADAVALPFWYIFYSYTHVKTCFLCKGRYDSILYIIFLQILHLKPILPAIPVHLRPLMAAHGRGTVDDPLANKFRVVAHFEILQAVAAVERLFTDVADIFGQANPGQVHTFEERAVL